MRSIWKEKWVKIGCICAAVIALAAAGIVLSSNRDSVPDDIEYDGTVYSYNRNLTNVVLLGVDYMTGNTDHSVGHQADTILVLSVDIKDRTVVLIDIPRDTLTQVNQYDLDGNLARTTLSPIAVSHSFGTSETQSAAYTENAVSYLLYGVPINNYLSMNIDGISVANDMVDGVPVDVLEDFSMIDPAMTKGANVTLMGENALNYVRQRSLPGMSGSNLDRMNRQIQYMKSFLGRLKEKTRQDIAFPLSMLEELEGYVYTDLDAKEFTSIIGILMQNDASDLRIKTISGTMADDGFTANEQELKTFVRETFYERFPEEN